MRAPLTALKESAESTTPVGITNRIVSCYFPVRERLLADAGKRSRCSCSHERNGKREAQNKCE